MGGLKIYIFNLVVALVALCWPMSALLYFVSRAKYDAIIHVRGFDLLNEQIVG